MRRIFFVGITLLSAPFAQAGNLPPAFDSSGWNQIVQNVIAHGDRTETLDGETRSFNHLAPNDKSLSHQADYFSATGSAEEGGAFQANQVSLVSENWQKTADGNWDIDQRLFQANLEGELTTTLHIHIVETPQGDVLANDRLPSGAASDPAELATWGEILGHWESWENPKPAIHYVRKILP